MTFPLSPPRPLGSHLLAATVVITSLGYFVDMFDMFLFNMLRVRSLADLGLQGAELTESGLFISNCQFAGFLLGAWLSGTLADRMGRKKALYLSILAYALGSLLSACAHDVTFYGLARFIAGLGLAGELGTGVTLIAESLTPARRGMGSLVFAGMGLLGVMAAAAISEFLPWRHAYALGAVMGLALLFTRMLLPESSLYTAQKLHTKRGGLAAVFLDSSRMKLFLCSILIMVPAVFTPQLLWTLSPEFAAASGLGVPIKANLVIGIGFAGALLGEIMAISLSERLQSRRRATGLFLAAGILVFAKYVFWPAETLAGFYLLNGAIGVTFGGWVIGSIWAAEQFGTNIRATAVTTIPNFARALTIPMNVAYAHLKAGGPVMAVTIIGFTVFALALLGWRGLKETWGRDLAFSEIL